MAAEGLLTTQQIETALQTQGWGSTGVVLLRHGSTSVYHVEGIDAILRVERAGAEPSTVQNMLSRAIRWSAMGAPVVPPLSESPLELDGYLGTLWHRAEEVPRQARARSLGLVLRRLHDCPMADGKSFAPATSLDKVAMRLEALPNVGVPPSIVRILEDQRLRISHASADRQGRHTVPIHGDAHQGNLMQWNRRPALVDLDDLSFGPREVDFAPTLVASKRFPGAESDFEALIGGYGEVRLDWNLLNELVALRELTMNTWLASLWAVRSDAQSELGRRLELDGKGKSPWNPL